MSADETASTGATMIIGQRILAGFDGEYQLWQRRLSDAAAGFPGFVGADLRPPTDIQPEWVVVYQFDSVSHLQDWLNSRVRSTMLEEGARLFDGPGTAQLLSAEHRQPDTLVTVVVSHRVAPEHVDDFLAWQKRLDEAESGFPGFCGSEVFRPIDGVHDEWTISYRYDSAEHLDAWLTSDRRQEMLAEAEHFGDFTLRTIDHSFGNWFSFGYDDGPPPSNFKSSIAVWMGLYPTVVLLTLMTAWLGMPLWLGMLVGNLLSSLTMSYFTMPYYVNRILGWWLKPRRDAPQPATDWRGFGLVLAINAFWVVVFFLVTTVFWSLP